MNYELKEPLIIILSGKSGSGKTLVASIIKDYYGQKQTIELAYADYLKMYAKNIINWDGLEETKPRTFLQELGIELIKNKIDDKLLINRIIQDIKVYSYFYNVIIVSDARLKEEVEIPKKMFKKTISIKIVNKNKNSLTLKQQQHLTEIDNVSEFDYIIENNSTIETLKDKIIQILKEQ